MSDGLDGNIPVWGTMIPLDRSISGKIDLTKPDYTFGTGENCDYQIIVHPNQEHAYFEQYSEIHFRLEKEDTDSETLFYIHDLSDHGTYVNGKKIGKNYKRPLEPDSEISLVSVENKAFIFIVESPADLVDIPDEIKSSYIISKTLGRGAFGKVRLLFTQDGTAKVAMKCVEKSPYYGITDAEVLRETEIMVRLKHPCIIEIIETHNTPTCLYIIMELAEAGTLQNRLKRHGKLEEMTTRIIIHQILLAVEYLHKQGITHRDLKPDNILLTTRNLETLIKVTDFGVSKAVTAHTLMKTLAGTPCYIAPEIWKNQIIRGKYSNAVDVWSIGIIFYQCLIGDLPIKVFGQGQYRHDLMETYTIQQKFDSYIWAKMPQAEDLGRKLLKVEPTERILVQDALKHEWFQNEQSLRRIEELTGLALEGSGKAAMNVNPSDRRPSKPNTLVKKRVQELSDSQSNQANTEGDTKSNKSEFIKRRVQELGASFLTPDHQKQSNGQGQQTKAKFVKQRSGSSPSVLDGRPQQRSPKRSDSQEEQKPQGAQQQGEGTPHKQAPSPHLQRKDTPSPHQQQRQQTPSPHQQQRIQGTPSPRRAILRRSPSPQQRQLKQVEEKNIKLQLYIRSPDKPVTNDQKFFPDQEQGKEEPGSESRSGRRSSESLISPSDRPQTQSLPPQHKESGDEDKTDASTLPPLPKNPPPPLPSDKKPPATKARKPRRSRAQKQAQSQQEGTTSPQTTEQPAPSPSPTKLTKVEQKEDPEQQRDKQQTPTKQLQRKTSQSPVSQLVERLDSESPTPKQSSPRSFLVGKSKSPDVTAGSPVVTAGSGTTSPVVVSGTKSPVVTAGTKSPVVTPGTKSPVVTSGTTSPIVTAGSKSPVVTAGTKSTVVTSGTKSPVVITGSESPVVTSGAKSPVVTSGTKSPVVITGSKSPVVTSGAKSPVVTSGTKSPVVITGSKSPVVTAGTQSPALNAGTKSPVTTGTSPVVTTGIKSTVVTAGTKSPALSGGSKSPEVTSGITAGTKSPVTAGFKSPPVTTGSKSPLVTTGSASPVVTSGSKSPAENHIQQIKKASPDKLPLQNGRQSVCPPKKEVSREQPSDTQQEAENKSDEEEDQKLKVSVKERIAAAERAAKEKEREEQLERERLGHNRRLERQKNRVRARTESPKLEPEQKFTNHSQENAPTKPVTVQQTEKPVIPDPVELKIKQLRQKEQLHLENLERERLEQQRREEEFLRQQQELEHRRRLQREADENVLVELQFDQKELKRVSVSEFQEQELERLEQERFKRQRLAEEQLKRQRQKQEEIEREKLHKENLGREKSERERIKKEKFERERKIQERLQQFKTGAKPGKEKQQKPVKEDFSDSHPQPHVDPIEQERLERRRFIESQLHTLKESQAQEKEQFDSQNQERIEKLRARKLKYQEEEERLSQQRKVAEQQQKAEQEKRIEKKQKAGLSKLDQRIQNFKRKEQERLGLPVETEETHKEDLQRRQLEEQRIYARRLEQQLVEDEQLLLDMEQFGDPQLGETQPLEQPPDDEYQQLLAITKQLEEKQRLVDQMLMEKKKQLEDKRKHLAATREAGSIEAAGDFPLLQQMTSNPKNAVIKKRAEEIIGRSQKPEAISPNEDDELRVFKPVHPAPVKSIPSAKTRHPSEDIGETIPTAKPVPLPRTSQESHDTTDDDDSEADDDEYDDVLEVTNDLYLADDPQVDYVQTMYQPQESYLQKAQEILRSPQVPGQDHTGRVTFREQPGTYIDEHGTYIEEPGTYIDEHGTYIEDPGMYLEEQGFSPNGDPGFSQHQVPQYTPSAPQISTRQKANEILSQRITADDVKNKLEQLREQFLKNSMKNVSPEPEPEPEPETNEPEMTSEDILMALERNQHEPEVILDALTQLLRWLQTQEFSEHSEGLSKKQKLEKGVLLSMMKHPYDNRIQMICSACLFQFMKEEYNQNLTDKNRSDMLAAMLNCLDNHPDDAALTRRCCSCLEMFDIPYDMLLDIDRVVQILVRIVSVPHSNKFIKLQCVDMAIELLNRLSLPHPDLNKPFEANLGALSVHAMLEIIEDRLQSQTCDIAMETAWSVLWNVTYDTPENCVRFMTSSGLDLFLDCIKVFHERTQLHVNMIGLMTNLAEAKYVRTQLMKPEAAEVIANVWEFMANSDTQLSYCACSVMARLVADGAASWKMSSPTHKDTCERIVQSIASWNMNKSAALYRGCSLQPVLRLVTMTSSPEAQYWAAWTICSLVKNERDKYCFLLDREGGKNKLDTLIRSNTSDVIKELANKTLELYAQYKIDRKK